MPTALMRFNFPVPLPCVPDLLGVRVPVQLPGAPTAELCMPVEGKRTVDRFDGAAFQPPRVRGMAWLTRVNDRTSRDEWKSWGHYVQGGPDPESWVGSVRGAVLRVAVADASDAALLEMGLTVHRSLYAWYLLLRDWLEVLTHVDLDHEHPVHGALGPSDLGSTWVGTPRLPGEMGFALVAHTATIRLHTNPKVARRELQRATREANLENHPPEPHLLLRDARSALRRGLYRRCILDAATATEIVVSDRLIELLDQAVGQPAREALVRKNEGIARKIPIVERLGGPLPAKLQEGLFNVRNKVIHEGKQASLREARTALDKATTAVMGNAPI